MLLYFIVFTSIGIALARLSSRNVAFGYMLFISAFWGARSEIVWGLAALGELSLGYFIGLSVFGSREGDKSTAKVSPQEKLKIHLRSSMHDQQIADQLTKPTQSKTLLDVFQKRVLDVLNKEFNYFPDLNGFQREVFTKVTTNAIQLDINEYDAAIGFILLQLKALTRPLSAAVIDFYVAKLGTCIRLAPMSKGGFVLIEIFVVDHKDDFDENIADRPELSLAADILRNETKGIHSSIVENDLIEEASEEAARTKHIAAPVDTTHISPSEAPSKDAQPSSYDLMKGFLLLTVVVAVIYFLYQNQLGLPKRSADTSKLSDLSMIGTSAEKPVALHRGTNEHAADSVLSQPPKEGDPQSFESSFDDKGMSGSAHYALAQFKLKSAQHLHDFEDVRKDLTSAISSGENLAAYELGFLHENGLISDSSIDQAMQYYEIAADAMSANASYRLGMIYSANASIPAAREKALKYFDLARSLGHKDASNQFEKLNQ